MAQRNEGCASFGASLGVRDIVRLSGYSLDPERFYQAADIVLLPTAHETFCRAGHEATACGLPLVGTAVTGVEIIGANEAAIIVECNVVSIA